MCDRWACLAMPLHPEIRETDPLHYHHSLSRSIMSAECDADARTTPDQELIPVGAESGILIRPKTRPRTVAGADPRSYQM